MIQGLCVTHTKFATIDTGCCSLATLSPVFDRHAESLGSHHRTAPPASTVLSAPLCAFSVSDTATACYLSHNPQKTINQVLAKDGVDIASKRLHRATSANNTTQAVGAVWCMDRHPYQPLGERRQCCSVLKKELLLNSNSILNEEGTVLFSKTDSVVMLLLPSDIAGSLFAVAKMSAENNMIQGLCVTHTKFATIDTGCCSLATLSPVFDRHAESLGSHHRTAPPASTVLSAPLCAFSVSDTATACYLSHNPQKTINQVLAKDGVDIASKRLHRATSASNTTQAVGAVWCMDRHPYQPLGERRQCHSVLMKELLPNSNSILNEEGTVLFSKTDSVVMLFLTSDIAGNHFAVAHTVCESGILFSPAVKGREMRIGFEPFACRHLEILHKLGHRQCGRERYENMQMVWHTADTVQVSTYVVDEAENIGVEFALMLDADCVLTAMSAENDMIQGLCVTHTRITTIDTEYCTLATLSPVFDRHAESLDCHHRTAPPASTVLSAPLCAFSVSDTAIACYLSHNQQKAIKQMLATDGVDTASKRLDRATSASNTTQAVGAVWCMNRHPYQPLGERRQCCSVLKKELLPNSNSIFNEEGTVLFSKTDSAVMLFLPSDIAGSHRHGRHSLPTRKDLGRAYRPAHGYDNHIT